MSAEYTQVFPSDRTDFDALISGVIDAVWPEFMDHDAVSARYWGTLFKEFPDYQFAIVDTPNDAIVGAANSIPLSWNHGLEELPDGGWDWALAKGIEDLAAGSRPNLVCALQIAIAPAYRRKGLSYLFIDCMRRAARTSGFSTLIAPVRPSHKDRYPLSGIDSYIEWKLQSGLPYDPWLRAHARKGGRIVKPCTSSMRIVGTVSEWEDWTGLVFFESGLYPVEGALAPVRIDLSANIGVYVEPNVWVVHDLSQADEA